ncbi:hypothetical protein PYW08_003087 [Mythimna loreyi]|uniref:Uncharacterized protein n=1 Tax=Mythimna loreyi TaxID=667449 RepID=A0ACC2QUD0_9NEOP|nr:hypothetical protein PYW08_003087 [Mythimna loreyi]
MFKTKCGLRDVKNKITALDIGTPTDLKRNIHVTKNSETGRLEGLPTSWAKLWNKLSKNKEDVSPEGAQTNAQFYVEDEKSPKTPFSDVEKKIEGEE